MRRCPDDEKRQAMATRFVEHQRSQENATPIVSSSERRCGECGHDNVDESGTCVAMGRSMARYSNHFSNCGCKCVFPATGAGEATCEHGILQSAECLNCTEEYIAVNSSDNIAGRVATEILDAIWMGAIPLTCENGDAAREGLATILARHFPAH